VELGKATANTNSIPGEGQSKYFAVKDGVKKIGIDTSAGHQFLMERSDNAGQYIQAQLDSGETRIAFLGAGGQVNIRTADCLYLGVPRSVSIKAVKSCDPSDPPNSNWVRLVLCSDRIRIS
jgi:hypothetical protein